MIISLIPFLIRFRVKAKGTCYGKEITLTWKAQPLWQPMLTTTCTLHGRQHLWRRVTIVWTTRDAKQQAHFDKIFEDDDD